MATAALRWLGWRGGLALVVMLALAAALWSRSSWKAEAGRWQETAGVWKMAQQAQELAYKSAQSAARAKAEAQKAKDEVRYRELAERADHADQQIANLRAASQRYAQRNSLQNVKARITSGTGGRPGAAGESGVASGSDGLRPDAVVVSAEDFNTLVDNSERLIKVRNWGQSLIADGKAVALEGDR